MCRSVVVCEAMGLWAAAHADGSMRLRMLPAGHINERYTITLPRDAPPVMFDDSEFCAPFVVRSAHAFKPGKPPCAARAA